MKSARITIFEGPDGAGKTTLAKAYAKATGAKYLHFDALRGIRHGAALMRHYADSMMPAVLGHQDIVMDRCWLSEEPYAEAYHKEPGRLDSYYTRRLERLAMRCGAVVVLCLPPLDIVVDGFVARQSEEMMDNTDQISQVYHSYHHNMTTHLPCVSYDFTGRQGNKRVDAAYLEEFRHLRHPIDQGTAGNLNASILLAEGPPSAHRDWDHHYRWPGASRLLAVHLDEFMITEDELMWASATADDRILIPYLNRHTIALGQEAHNQLLQSGIDHISMPLPAEHLAESDQPYPLGPKLQELLS